VDGSPGGQGVLSNAGCLSGPTAAHRYSRPPWAAFSIPGAATLRLAMSARRERKPSIAIGDAEYLRALSGSKQRGTVRAWRQKEGIKTFDNNDGWPVTTEGALERALSRGVKAGPDWSNFDAWKTGTHWRHRRRRQEMGIPEPTAQPTVPAQMNAGNATVARRKRSKQTERNKVTK
jgi:hypothetical protein